MLRCEMHFNWGLLEYENTGCDVVGGPGQAARYECPPDRQDLWEKHMAEHKAWEERVREERARLAEIEKAKRLAELEAAKNGN